MPTMVLRSDAGNRDRLAGVHGGGMEERAVVLAAIRQWQSPHAPRLAAGLQPHVATQATTLAEVMGRPSQWDHHGPAAPPSRRDVSMPAGGPGARGSGMTKGWPGLGLALESGRARVQARSSAST